MFCGCRRAAPWPLYKDTPSPPGELGNDEDTSEGKRQRQRADGERRTASFLRVVSERSPAVGSHSRQGGGLRSYMTPPGQSAARLH